MNHSALLPATQSSCGFRVETGWDGDLGCEQVSKAEEEERMCGMWQRNRVAKQNN